MIGLTVYSLPAIFAPSIVTILAASEIGHHFGLRVAGQANVAILDAAMLGLLALMISFTFAMALARFDARRDALLNGAKAIGTAALRARLLPAPHGAESLKRLRDSRRHLIAGIPFLIRHTAHPRASQIFNEQALATHLASRYSEAMLHPPRKNAPRVSAIATLDVSRLRLRCAAVLIEITHMADALTVACCKHARKIVIETQRLRDDSFIVFPAIAGDAMSILERTEKRRADFTAAFARDPDNGLEELLELYWWWGSDTADFFIESSAKNSSKPKRSGSRA